MTWSWWAQVCPTPKHNLNATRTDLHHPPGWHGLAAAKTYIELHPTEDIVILEAENSIGGTWSHDRLYPGLKSNNLHGTYEHPDFPMDPVIYKLKSNAEHIPGATLHRYLTDFAKHFGIFDRTRFNTKADSLEPTPDGGWALGITTAGGDASILRTRKIIIATGLTSRPNFPIYAGAEAFGAPYFHAKDFCRNAATVLPNQNVVVVGGAKSAMDVAYAYVEAGSQVDLVIRPEGNGPVWISHPWVMGGKKRLEKLLSVRWMTWFSPCPWGGTDGSGWVRRLLHGTFIGRWIVDQFWGGLGGEVLATNGYASHPELRKLQPWHSAFWIGSGLSIHNYDANFFDLVRSGRIRVHVANVAHLSAKTVHLDDSSALKADVLVCATGWRKEPTIAFHNFGPAGIGLTEPRAEQARLATLADEEILSAYPKLRHQPALSFKPANHPFRLYRFIVPPARLPDRNIAFAGLVSSVSTAWAANIQALWIAAYLDGRLDRAAPSPAAATREIMLHTQWGKWRYPCGYGASLPDFVFDALPYMDLLLQDLGLKVLRKGSWWADLTVPYGPEDYRGLVGEWVEVHGGGKGGKV